MQRARCSACLFLCAFFKGCIIAGKKRTGCPSAKSNAVIFGRKFFGVFFVKFFQGFVQGLTQRDV